MAFEKVDNQTIARRLGVCAKTVGLWRRRWRDSFAALLQMQFTECDAAFQRAIIECLSDAPRCGSPGKFTAEQIMGLIGIACEPPEKSGRPVTSWTGSELADESQARGLVDSISASHVNRILREVDLQPHHSQYWCNTTEKDPALFQQQVELVCQTYRDAPQLYHQSHTHTVCVDEMTSLQANERRAETKLPKPSQIAKEEFQDTRHGTVCVTGNWHVVRGQVLAPTISETRDNEDFAQHIEQTISTDPQAGWVFVVDNLNTHCGGVRQKILAVIQLVEKGTLDVTRSVSEGERFQGIGIARLVEHSPSLTLRVTCCQDLWAHPCGEPVSPSGCDRAGNLGDRQEVRPSEHNGNTTCFSSGSESSHSFRVSPQTQFVAQPDRNHFRHHQSPRDTTRQLHVQVGLDRKTPTLHQVLP